MSSTQVLGVDACVGGWCGVLLRGRAISVHQAEHIDTLVHQVAGPLDVVAIDMPIGLADDGPRAPDLAVRKLVGPRASSVFFTPVRCALEASTHAEASLLSRQRTGKGVSAQAFALRRKILEVERWVQNAGCRVIEVHPEVSFARMAGRHLPPKKSWAGVHQRQSLLAEAGIGMPHDIGPAGSKVAVDDVLDAAAAGWSARRKADGTAVSYPDPPVRYGDGWECAIWV
jgi:predicted RNase H-like nuclease